MGCDQYGFWVDHSEIAMEVMLYTLISMALVWLLW